MQQWQRVESERVLLVDSAEPGDAPVRVSMRIGQRLPVFAGALGRCFAAYSDMPKDEMLEQFKHIRLASPITSEDWLDQLNKVRQTGYAIDAGQLNKGITSISVPVFDANAQPFLAISAIVLDEQVSESALAALARDMTVVSRTASRSAPTM